MSGHVQREAAHIREEWLAYALSTRPTDRPAAETAISALYELIGLAPPRFHWVASPLAALATVPPGVRPRTGDSVDHVSEWPLPRRFASLVTELCLELDMLARWADRPMDQLIRAEVRHPLLRSVRSTMMTSLMAAHDRLHRTTWYETQSIAWIAHYDALRRAAGIDFTPDQSRRLNLWAAVARSCSWWWPYEGICVVSERPSVVRTEAWDREVRLHSADGPAISYPGGWDIYAWHGRPVPSWVVTDPSVDRIQHEPNVEVRRCAIEHIGWPAYIDQASLRLIASAPDPGNPGAELRLYDLRRQVRVLLAVNGSVERDGHRRQYGLTVPGYLDDPIAAAAWTYGLSAEQYSLLVRRT